MPDSQGEWVSSADKSDDLYANFVRQATRIDRLSEEEERALGLRVRDHQDQAAAKKLVYHNMRLAIKMAHQYRRSWTSLMDLVQEALAGMSIASGRWDPDQNTRFGTYATYWIKAQLGKFLMTNSRLIHTANSRAGRKVYFGLPQIKRELLAKGIEPTPELIAKELGEDPHEVALIMDRLDAKESSLSGMTHDTMASDWDDPETQSAKSEIQKTIGDMIGRFEKSLENERDLAIWKEHLLANEPVNLVDLGKRYGVSKQRMGQLADRLKKAFRRHVIDTLGPNTQLSWLFSEDSVR
ncbi:MAG: sigma-70 family RNA polymerase sigma factor [Myxococcaceae bacterium]